MIPFCKCCPHGCSKRYRHTEYTNQHCCFLANRDFFPVLANIVTEKQVVCIDFISNQRQIIIQFLTCKSSTKIQKHCSCLNNQECSFKILRQVSAHNLQKRKHKINRYHSIQVLKMGFRRNKNNFLQFYFCFHITGIPQIINHAPYSQYRQKA